MRPRIRRALSFLALATLVAWVAASSSADDPAPATGKARLELLDRGAPRVIKANATRTHTGLPTATLANLAGTPGATMAFGFIGAPIFPGGIPIGYFFPPVPGTMPVPGAFPTSYLPFAVTGAYGFVGSFLGISAMGGLMSGASPVLAAGVAPGPFTAGTGTWLGFVTAMTPFVPGPSMVFGGMAIFPHSPPALSVPATPTGLGVACGIDATGTGGIGLLVLGALTPVGTGGGKPLSGLMPPGTMSGLAPFPASPATYVVGCFITGATVPVELQAFFIE